MGSLDLVTTNIYGKALEGVVDISTFDLLLML